MNGFIKQEVVYTNNFTGSAIGIDTITFPVPFSNTNYFVIRNSEWATNNMSISNDGVINGIYENTKSLNSVQIFLTQKQHISKYHIHAEGY